MFDPNLRIIYLGLRKRFGRKLGSGFSTSGTTAGPISSTPNPPIDFDIFFSRCRGNVPFALALLDELEASIQQQAAAIIEHTTRDEFGEAIEVAHSLQGAAGGVGAETLQNKALELEALGRAATTDHLLQITRELQREIDRCLNYIPTLRIDLHDRSSLPD